MLSPTTDLSFPNHPREGKKKRGDISGTDNHQITRAKREASARIDKDVRLLLEEIKTIRDILQQQQEVFRKMFQRRESAMQKLDHRVQRRTLAHLDDTEHHFEKLLEHAEQAQFWTRHSIEIRGEDNSKAIYVFTAVTVIFLPLSFVAGLLGMNTREIRQTTDNQWLFWAVAMPFTVCVLIICICIVQFRFSMKKRWNAGMGMVVRCWRPRTRRRGVRFV
jgi:Mg2+ and Co2+ transporter CorA